MATGKYELPIEIALGNYDPKIYEMVRDDRENGGTCELCGLWNSREVAGMGIGSYILARIGAVVAVQLPVKSIFVLCAPITVRMGKRVGAVVEGDLGNEGLFYYPKDDLIATAMRLRDIHDLQHADITEQEKIMSLRADNHQILFERGPRGTFEVEYNLEIPNKDRWSLISG